MGGGLGNAMTALGTAGTAPTDLFSMAGTMLDKPNQYGRSSMGSNVLKSAGSLGSVGGQIGSMFGPQGQAIGMAVGTAAGIAKGVLDTNKQKRVEGSLRGEETRDRLRQAYSLQDVGQGNAGGGYYANGGSLLTSFLQSKARGGSLKRLSSDSVEVDGPSHSGGGVTLPEGNEVEGKETIKGDYVLSHRLGFAQVHKPLAKAIGKLEQKPLSQSSLNSLRRLRSQEDALMLMQEQTKQDLGLQ